MERAAGITWGDLTAIEPRLEDLLWAARRASVGCRRWSEVDPAFVPVRSALTELIGFAGGRHRHPVLGSPGAYQVAYWKLYDAVAGLLPCGADGAEREIAFETCPAKAA
jgi:hypothetical protein